MGTASCSWMARCAARMARYVTNAATAVNGQPIAIRAKPSHPVSSESYRVLLNQETGAEHRHPGHRGDVEGHHRPAHVAPRPVVGVDPTPDVTDHRAADDHRYPEQHGVHQRAPDTKQEIAFRLPHHVRDQGADAHREESRHRGLNRFAAEQPPDEDQCRHAQSSADRGHQPERRGHRDEHHHRQRRIDQAADAAHLFEDCAPATMGRCLRRVTLRWGRVACVVFGLTHF